MHVATNTSKSAFTLIELSIVLVIIGLMVAGVLSGRTLLRQSEMRSVITDIDSYKAAITTFQGQYGYFPGDMPNASNYWTCQDSPGWTCADGTGYSFNGDGDGFINSYYCDYHDTGLEGLRSWEHLSLAGMMKGMYRWGSDGTRRPGFSIPASRVGNAGYELGCNGSTWFILPTGHHIAFAAPTGDRLLNSVVSPREAYDLDLKIDNGHPDDGTLITKDGNEVTTPFTCSTQYTNEYDNLTIGNPQCWLVFIIH